MAEGEKALTRMWYGSSLLKAAHKLLGTTCSGQEHCRRLDAWAWHVACSQGIQGDHTYAVVDKDDKD